MRGEARIPPNPELPLGPPPVLPPPPPLPPEAPDGADGPGDGPGEGLPVEKLEALLVKMTRLLPESFLHAWGSVPGMLVTEEESRESHIVVISSVVPPSVL